MALSLATPTDAHASVVTVGPHDIRSLFYIGKSDDRNQVHYGVRLDSNCVPIGNEPVFPYWKQIEKGTDVYESLSLLDRTVYSVRKQTVVRSPNASWITFELKATSKRSLTAYVQKVNGQCVAETHTIISGKTARLQRIFVQLGGLFSVRYIDIFGSELGSNQPLVERTKP